MGIEKRKFTRFNSKLKVQLTNEREVSYTGFTKDLSFGGAYMRISKAAIQSSL